MPRQQYFSSPESFIIIITIIIIIIVTSSSSSILLFLESQSLALLPRKALNSWTHMTLLPQPSKQARETTGVHYHGQGLVGKVPILIVTYIILLQFYLFLKSNKKEKKT